MIARVTMAEIDPVRMSVDRAVAVVPGLGGYGSSGAGGL